MDPNGPATAGGDGNAATTYRPPRLAFFHRLTFRLAAVVLIGVIPLAIVLAWAGVSGRDRQRQSAAAKKQALAYLGLDRKTRGPNGVAEDDPCTRLELLARMDERNPVGLAHALEEQTFD